MNKNNPRRIMSSVKLAHCIECTLDDFSIWRCDVNGDNWEEIKPSDEFLAEKFNLYAQSRSPQEEV